MNGGRPIFCPACGTSVISDAKFGTGCGTELPQFASSLSPPFEPNAASQPITAINPAVYRGLLLRGLAFSIDLVLLATACFFIFVAGYDNLGEYAFDAMIDTWTWLIPLLLFSLYFAIFEGSPLRASPGKLCVRVRVVGLDGMRLGVFRALGRQLVKLLSILFVGAGIVVGMFSPQRRTWHDRISGSVVITSRTSSEAVAGDFRDIRTPATVWVAACLLLLGLAAGGFIVAQDWHHYQLELSGALDDPKMYGASAEPPK